jgi:sec-independent protein translocase protein TatA
MGTGEIILICVVVVVIFGATKLPQLGDGLGRAIKNFKRAMNSGNEIEVSPGKKGELGDSEKVADAADVTSSDKKSTTAAK